MAIKEELKAKVCEEVDWRNEETTGGHHHNCGKQRGGEG